MCLTLHLQSQEVTLPLDPHADRLQFTRAKDCEGLPRVTV